MYGSISSSETTVGSLRDGVGIDSQCRKIGQNVSVLCGFHKESISNILGGVLYLSSFSFALSIHV